MTADAPSSEQAELRTEKGTQGRPRSAREGVLDIDALYGLAKAFTKGLIWTAEVAHAVASGRVSRDAERKHERQYPSVGDGETGGRESREIMGLSADGAPRNRDGTKGDKEFVSMHRLTKSFRSYSRSSTSMRLALSERTLALWRKAGPAGISTPSPAEKHSTWSSKRSSISPSIR